MDRAQTLPSRAWSCSGLAKGVNYMVSGAVKEEPAQDLSCRLSNMTADQLRQQIVASWPIERLHVSATGKCISHLARYLLRKPIVP